MGELAIVLRNPPGDGPTGLGIAGPLTHATAPVLRDYLRRLMDTTTGAPCIMLDMSCCTGIDVDGLLALAVAQHAARLRGGDLRLTHTPALVARQIRQHTFDHLLDDPPTTRSGLADTPGL
jgi:anti-anti-sigma regulatory factor